MSKKSHKPRPSGRCLSRSVARGPPFQGSVGEKNMMDMLVTADSGAMFGVSRPITGRGTMERACSHQQ